MSGTLIEDLDDDKPLRRFGKRARYLWRVQVRWRGLKRNLAPNTARANWADVLRPWAVIKALRAERPSGYVQYNAMYAYVLENLDRSARAEANRRI